MVNKKLLFSLFLGLLLVPGFVLAQHSVAGDLTSFANGFKALFSGDVPGFAAGIVNALPLFGLIFVIYALAYYLSIITIFRGNDPRYQRFGNIFGIGLALLGLAQQSVYNMVLGLSTAMLSIIFLLLSIFIVWMFLNVSRTGLNETEGQMHTARGTRITAERATNRIEHETGMERREFGRTERQLDRLSNRLDRVTALTGTELQQIDQLARMLTQVTSSAHDMNAVSNFGRQLSHGIAGLITTMNHTRGPINNISAIISRINSNLTFVFTGGTRTDQAHLEHILTILLRRHYPTRALPNLTIYYNSNPALHTPLRRIMHRTQELQNYLTQINNFNTRFPDYASKHDVASQVQQHIHRHEYEASQRELDRLREMVQNEVDIVNDITRIDGEINNCIADITATEATIVPPTLP
jgi:ABC-type multidrug transport system fused ATPase/permease subunit